MSSRRYTREDSGLVLDREGRWFHEGVEITHPKIAQAFSRGIQRAPDGRYILRIGEDWCYVTVEDAPLQVLSVVPEPDTGRAQGPARPRRLLLRLSCDALEPLDPSTLTLRGDVLYCTARGMPARFSRAAQAALAPYLDERPEGYALVLDEQATPIR